MANSSAPLRQQVAQVGAQARAALLLPMPCRTLAVLEASSEKKQEPCRAQHSAHPRQASRFRIFVAQHGA